MNLHDLGFLQRAAQADRKSKVKTQRDRGDEWIKKFAAGGSCCVVETKVGEKVRTGIGEALMQMLNRQIV